MSLLQVSELRGKCLELQEALFLAHEGAHTEECELCSLAGEVEGLLEVLDKLEQKLGKVD